MSVKQKWQAAVKRLNVRSFQWRPKRRKSSTRQSKQVIGKHLTIRQKLWGLVILALIMVAGVGGYSLLSLADANRQGDDIVNNWNKGLDYAHELNTLAANYRALELEHIVTEDAAAKEELMTKMKDIRARINEIAPKYEKTASGETDKELFANFSKQWRCINVCRTTCSSSARPAITAWPAPITTLSPSRRMTISPSA